MKLKDSKAKFIAVRADYYRLYKSNAFINPQAQAESEEEAMLIASSFEMTDGREYIVVKGESK